jgi:uncharacterized protein (TIGR02186 family)
VIRVFLLLLALALPARAAEEVLAGLSQTQVAITADFSGLEILIWGAVKREAAPPPGEIGVIVTVVGPSKELTVRRKSRRYGVWVNTEAVVVDAAPTFYAVATTAPWEDVISDTEDLRYKISVPRAIRSVGNLVSDSPAFTEALIRIRSTTGQYLSLPSTVTVTEQTMFSTSVALPANLTEGEYRTRVFLTRSGRVIDEYVAVIDVEKAGLERAIFEMARRWPLSYGLLCLMIAVAAGWGASEMFRYIRS